MATTKHSSLGKTTDLALGRLNTSEHVATLRTHVERLRIQCVRDRGEGLTPMASAHLDHALALLGCAVAQLDLATYGARQRA